MSTKRMVATMVAALMLTLCVSVVLAAKDNPMGVAPKQNLTLYAPAVVGGTLLPAGSYTVTHDMQGQTHIMIFKQVGGKAEAKANCTLVPLNAKAQRTEQRFAEGANSQRVLVEMTFQGDTATHMLAQ